MTDLDTRVRQAFDNVTVPDDVKRGTLTYIASIAEASGVSAETAPASAAAPRKHARARIIPLRRAAAALAACLALAFAGFGGFAYAQPTTYVGIDVNPSIELGVNRFGIVVRVEALNGDGESLLDAVSLTGRGYADALSLLTQSDAFSPYAQEDSYIEISVTSDDARQAEAIRQQSDACLSALPCRGSCHAVDEGTREAAVSAGMGVGRYRAALELVELDPSGAFLRGQRRKRLRERTARPWWRWGTARQRESIINRYVWHSWRVPRCFAGVIRSLPVVLPIRAKKV